MDTRRATRSAPARELRTRQAVFRRRIADGEARTTAPKAHRSNHRDEHRAMQRSLEPRRESGEAERGQRDQGRHTRAMNRVGTRKYGVSSDSREGPAGPPPTTGSGARRPRRRRSAAAAPSRRTSPGGELAAAENGECKPVGGKPNRDPADIERRLREVAPCRCPSSHGPTSAPKYGCLYDGSRYSHGRAPYTTSSSARRASAGPAPSSPAAAAA